MKKRADAVIASALLSTTGLASQSRRITLAAP
jgi:hypothetical protein